MCVCVFELSSLSAAPVAVMACLWDTDIKLSDWLSSAFQVSSAVHSHLSSRGEMSPVWLLSEDLSSFRFLYKGEGGGGSWACIKKHQLDVFVLLC